jgi:hypothetical protein
MKMTWRARKPDDDSGGISPRKNYYSSSSTDMSINIRNKIHMFSSPAPAPDLIFCQDAMDDM